MIRSRNETGFLSFPASGRAPRLALRALVGLALLLAVASCKVDDTTSVSTSEQQFIPGTASARPASQKTERVQRTLSAGGLERSYIAHLPPPPANGEPVRVLIAFHPALADGAFMERVTLLHEKPGAENFIVVYPDGVRRTWNAGRCCGLASRMGVDDLGFFDAIMDDLAKLMPVRPKAYVTGYSNGALLVYRLICSRPTRIAAAAPFAAYLPPEDLTSCQGGPIPLMHIHGDADKGAPLTGGETRYLGRLPPLKETILAIARRNRCDTSAVAKVSEPRLGTTCTAYQRCGDRAETLLCVVPGLGHIWPGATPLQRSERASGEDEQRRSPANGQMPALLRNRFAGGGLFKNGKLDLGPPRPDLDGSAAVIAFFLRH